MITLLVPPQRKWTLGLGLTPRSGALLVCCWNVKAVIVRTCL